MSAPCLPNLISDARVQSVVALNQGLAALCTTVPGYLGNLIQAASATVRAITMRDITPNSYIEYYNGGNAPYDVLSLRQYPIAGINRLAINPQCAITITNTDTTDNQYADVSTTDDGLGNCLAVVLNRFAAGVNVSTTFTAAAYPSLTALAAGINALGSSWGATIQSTVGNYATSTLRTLQGNVSAFNSGAALELYLDTPLYGGPGSFSFWGDGSPSSWGVQNGWRLDANLGVIWGCFPAWQMGIRVEYSTYCPDGTICVPQDIQQATLRAIQILYQLDATNPAITSLRLGPQAVTYDIKQSVYNDATIKGLLSKYIAREKMAIW